jgi:sigma-B regulation protein RsbU (phosphoserine phosphatase)
MTVAEIGHQAAGSGVGAARNALLERRARLTRVGVEEHPELAPLLREVDAALERIASNDYGRCDTCHDTIEPRVLEADPAARFCVDCMSEEERLRLARDLELAQVFQFALLPPADVEVAGWELAVHYQPLGPLGGDTCAIVAPERAGGALHFLFGDVAGKGVAASLLMAHLHALFRSLVALELPLHETLARVNRLFCQSIVAGSYATAIAGRLEASGRVELCNAGHPPALFERGGSWMEAAGRGLPLGLFPGAEYGSVELDLAGGERLVLYTDGVSEAEDRGGGELGRAGLRRALSGVIGRSARETVSAVLEAVESFRGASPANDDLTLLSLRRVVSTMATGEPVREA